jgi:hypothetical protein
MLEVSRDVVLAGEEQLISCTAEQSNYYSICTVTLDPCGDLPFTSWSEMVPFLRGAMRAIASLGCEGAMRASLV